FLCSPGGGGDCAGADLLRGASRRRSRSRWTPPDGAICNGCPRPPWRGPECAGVALPGDIDPAGLRRGGAPSRPAPPLRSTITAGSLGHGYIGAPPDRRRPGRPLVALPVRPLAAREAVPGRVVRRGAPARPRRATRFARCHCRIGRV